MLVIIYIFVKFTTIKWLRSLFSTLFCRQSGHIDSLELYLQAIYNSINMYKSFLFLFFSLSSVSFAFAKPQDTAVQNPQNDIRQKKSLTHSVYDEWQVVDKPKLSTHGRYAAWEVNPQQGDGILWLRDGSGQLLKLPRGHRLQFTDDERFAVALVKPTYEQTRQAKIKKKKKDDMPLDSLVIIRLNDFTTRMFPRVKSFEMAQHNNKVVAFALGKDDKSKDKKKEKKDAAGDMMLYYFANADTLRLSHAESYAMANYGRRLAYVEKTDKHKCVMKVMDLNNRQTITINDTTAYVARPSFSWQADKLLFLASADTAKTGSKHCAIYEYKIGGKLRTLLTADYNTGLEEGWGVTENSAPFYSRDGKQTFAGIQPYVNPDDTTKYDFETAEPSIWRHDANELPPMLKVRMTDYRKQTILCTLTGGQLVPLGRTMYDRVRLANRGNAPYALSTDQTAGKLAEQWDIQGKTQLSLVDIRNGSRTPITDSQLGGAIISADGNHVAWFDLQQKQWMTWSRKDRQTRNLTARLKTAFHDEDDDHPMLAEPYDRAQFTTDSRQLLVADRYDVYLLSVDGKESRCLTQQTGRRDSLQYRYVSQPRPDDIEGVNLKHPIWLQMFNYRDKTQGFAMTDPKANLRVVDAGPHSYGTLVTADSAQVCLYKKGDFAHPMDLYMHTDKTQQLSHINPQQQDYLWGTAELYRWKAFDGTPLDGLLYKPEGFDPNKKYPVMIYFYERRSDNLYAYYSPAPSRSIINIPYFVSNGYVVFVPDIVYQPGHPGESAYNCIVSGAQSLTKLPWIDADHMAIQGQSWGGYQVAYLVTRTNMFAAAGAGAPVSNMTSAYGGIRWESGMSRQFQYEQTQSRIGKDLWKGYDLYIENSPLFGIPKIQTPLLITHNNADGAVPYYQGIEMFMGMRRLGKPVWLIEYDKEAHNLRERKNCKDLSERLSTFFDHYLKGAPMPDWMKPNTPYMINGKEIRRQ